MIKRDNFGFIIQHNADYPDQADGGDSARSTGLMAMAGSSFDSKLLPYFIKDGGLVRHPLQTQIDECRGLRGIDASAS